MNLACVGPLPPLRSGVADYAALLPHLRPHFSRIIAVVDGYVPQLPAGLVDEVYDVSDAKADSPRTSPPRSGGSRDSSPSGAVTASDGWWSGGKVIPLYQMGNHIHYHRYIYQALQRYPGITVLHDGNLLPFIHELTLAQGDRAGFLREVGFERGREGVAAAWASLRRAAPLPLEAYPMLARVARASLGVIVHNQYLHDRVLEAYPDACVTVVPLFNPVPRDLPPASRGELKEALGFDRDGLLIGAFGFIAPSKRLDQALRAFARLRQAYPQARLVCVGEVVSGYGPEFRGLLDELALGDIVRVTGYAPDETFLRYLRAVDVGVNLRYPTWGESSGTLLRLMACGVPTTVTDAGAFAELPDEAVVKVPAGLGEAAVDEVSALEGALRALLGDADRRAAIGTAAQSFVARHCEPGRVAEQYVNFIHAIVMGRDCVCTSST